MGAAGPRLAFVWQAQYTEPPDGAAARVGAAGPLGRGWLHVAGAVQRASWLPFAWEAQYTEPPEGAAARGRGWLDVAGAVQGASWLPFAWQAQYTEPPEGAVARVGAAGPLGRGWLHVARAAAFRVARAVHRAS